MSAIDRDIDTKFCVLCNGTGAKSDPFDGYVKTCPDCDGYGFITEEDDDERD